MTRSHLILRARPGRRDELERELDRLEVVLAAGEQPGLLGLQLLVPEDHPDDLLVEASWSSLAHFERWRSSELAEKLLRGLDDLLVAEPEVRGYRVVDTVG
jgi:heme-degrading monooxygenase HmoA